ncbi:hypothetical protein BLGI_5069 [Brevibacillus laterosporus GI-9]|nr:hypothetical protein BLGI_5069 [Brevibacillus laterosporus GI-9]
MNIVERTEFLVKKQDVEARYQMSIVSLDEIDPSDHLVRKIAKAIEFISAVLVNFLFFTSFFTIIDIRSTNTITTRPKRK